MLTPDADRPSPDRLCEFLDTNDFGQLVTMFDDVPLIVPTHFLYDGRDVVECHLDRRNPVFHAVERGAPLVVAVVAAPVFIPSYWNAPNRSHAGWAAPTSYYAAVQFRVDPTIVDDEAALAGLLTRQMRHHQPEGGHEPIAPGRNPYGRMLKAIRGLHMTIIDTKARFKFGAGKRREHRGLVADDLLARGGPNDAAARQFILDDLASPQVPPE